MSNWSQQLKLATGGSVGVPVTPAVNSVVQPVPVQPPNQPEPVNADAGASSQKAMQPPMAALLPKLATAQNGYQAMNTTPRFLLQDLVKQAQANAMDRARIAKEAAMQLKQASSCTCGKDPCECKDGKKEKDACSSKTASADEVSTDMVTKMAEAIEYILPHIPKLAAAQAPAPHMTEKTQEPGKGPGALHVTEAPGGHAPPGPSGQGKATSANTPPMHTGTQKSTAAGPSTQVPNDMHNPSGGKGEQTTAMPAGKGKTAEAVYAGNLAVLSKMAEGDQEYGLGKRMALHALANPVGALGLGASGVDVGQAAEAVGKNPYEEAFRTGLRGSAEGVLGAVPGAIAGGALGYGAGALAGKVLHVDPQTAKNVGTALGGLTGYAGGGLAGMSHGTKSRLKALQEEAAAQEATGAAKEGSASATMVEGFLAYIKQAEDAINPAHISAGAAVPPAASQSGEGTPATPSGSSMVGSNEAAINYTKQQAKAEPKRDMSAYVSEPALSAAHDSTLQQAFSHTGQAGVKISSANAAMQVSQARAILEKIASAATK